MNEIQVSIVSREELAGSRDALAEVRNTTTEVCDPELAAMDWWYFGGPHGGVCAGAFDGSRLVGLCGYGVELYRVGERTLRVAILSNAITHHAYRGRGVFTKIIDKLVAHARANCVEAVFGWPNPTALRIYLSRLGFSTLFHPVQYVRLADHQKSIGEGAASRLGIRLAGSLLDALFHLPDHVSYSVGTADGAAWDALNRQAGGTSETIDRDAGYMQWRLANPNEEYQQLVLRDSHGCVVAAAILSSSDRAGIRRTTIGALLYGDRSMRRALLGACLREARARESQLLGGIGRLNGQLAEICGDGFFPRRTTTPIVAIGTGREPLDRFVRWPFQLMDVDVF